MEAKIDILMKRVEDLEREVAELKASACLKEQPVVSTGTVVKLVLLDQTINEFESLMEAVRSLLSGYCVESTTIDCLKQGDNVIAVLYPNTCRSPSGAYIQGFLSEMKVRTGLLPLLLIGYWEQRVVGEYESWTAIEYLEKGTYRGPLKFWFKLYRNRFSKWMDDVDAFKRMLDNPSLLQVPGKYY